jgi:Asp-tRNA(Asn)/Glu-tRNA(Gln) amidotransferase A subunit family amidase
LVSWGSINAGLSAIRRPVCGDHLEVAVLLATHWAVVNVLVGLIEDGVLVGVQLMGAAGAEARLISLAGQLEQHQRWFERHRLAGSW